MSTFYIAEFCRFYLLIVLSIGVYGKLGSFDNFSDGVEKIFNLSEDFGKKRIAKGISVIVICAEVIAALLIAAGGALSMIGIGAAALLVTCFTIIVVIVLFQKRLIHCNCFGASTRAITWLDVARNIIILCACGIFLTANFYHSFYANAQLPILNNSILFCLAISLANYTANLKELQFLMRQAALR